MVIDPPKALICGCSYEQGEFGLAPMPAECTKPKNHEGRCGAALWTTKVEDEHDYDCL